ncbi:MAG: 50S ribosomal protein L10 [Clostridia bacterium]|nr:50S ribosomal protein L10 [Clostridia bacterium]
MSANLEAKKVIVEEIKDKINKAVSLTFVDYRGLTVEEDTKMRAELRKANVEYKVYKNRLLLKALEELGMTGYADILEGTTAVAFGMHDEVSAPKILVDTAEKTKKMQVKGGILNGARIDAKMVETLAKIPSKEVLISKLLYLLQSPVRSVAIALNAIAEKKEA